MEEEYGYMSLPLWARPNTIIALGSVDTRPDYDYSQDVAFHIFQLDDGISAAAEIPGLDGRNIMTAKAARTGDILKVTVDMANKPWYVVLRSKDAVEVVKGAVAEKSPMGVRIKAEAGMKEIEVKLLNE